jgi:hypothetical protein
LQNIFLRCQNFSKPTIYFLTLSWSQSSQQEKLEQRKAEIQKRLENEKMLLNVKSKEKSAMNVF